MLRLPGVPIIYLGRRSPGASSNLPPGIGRATLDCRYTWSCNPRDVLSEAYRYLRGGLLPRLFTLTRREIPCGRFFSVTLLYPHGYQVISLRGALRCPDFPLPATAGSDRADLHRKDNKIRRYSRFGGAIFGKCVFLLRTGRTDAVHAKFFGNIGLNSTFAKG